MMASTAASGNGTATDQSSKRHAVEQRLGAERRFLGSLLLAPQAIKTTLAFFSRERIGPADLTDPRHRVIYDAIVCLHRQREPVDLVSLQGYLASQSLLEDAGGAEYLNDLHDAAPPGQVEQSAEAVAQAVRSSAATPRRKPFTERVIDLADVEAPGDLPLMFGKYLLKGAAHWLTGQTGLGKSTWAYNVACSLAEGVPLWGIECEPQCILYMDMESGDVGRALKVERLYRDAPRVRGRLLFYREELRLPEDLAEMLAFAEAHQVTLIVFDTARRCFSVKDENDNAEVYNRIVPVLDALKQRHIATLTMGHPPKNGGLGARGAGAQEDAGDVNLTLTMHRGEVSDPGGVIALRVTKNRLLGLSIPPLFLRRAGDDQFERIGPDEAGEVEEETSGTPTARVRCAEAVLALLGRSPGPVRHTDIVKAMEAQGHAPSTAKRAIGLLQKEGQIGHGGEGYALG